MKSKTAHQEWEKRMKKEEYLHYFDWEMYLIILISYSFGFLGGLGRMYLIFLSFIFFAIPFYLKHLKDKKEVYRSIK